MLLNYSGKHLKNGIEGKMVSVELCQQNGKDGCEYLKTKVREDMTRVQVCVRTGKGIEPRYMRMCPDIEAML